VTLPAVPRSLQTGVAWLLAGSVFAAWVGWMEPPWQRAAQQRDDWAAAHAAAVARIEQQDRAIAVLQDREVRAQVDLSAIRGKLDEMAMVLYSLERRSR
jgi:hypothetical protein